MILVFPNYAAAPRLHGLDGNPSTNSFFPPSRLERRMVRLPKFLLPLLIGLVAGYLISKMVLKEGF